MPSVWSCIIIAFPGIAKGKRQIARYYYSIIEQRKKIHRRLRVSRTRANCTGSSNRVKRKRATPVIESRSRAPAEEAVLDRMLKKKKKKRREKKQKQKKVKEKDSQGPPKEIVVQVLGEDGSRCKERGAELPGRVPRLPGTNLPALRHCAGAARAQDHPATKRRWKPRVSQRFPAAFLGHSPA
jgi:hypothetical protein